MSSLMAGPAHTSEIAAQTTGSTAATGHTDRVNYIVLYIIVFDDICFPKLNEAEINVAVIYGPKRWF